MSPVPRETIAQNSRLVLAETEGMGDSLVLSSSQPARDIIVIWLIGVCLVWLHRQAH